MGFGDKQLFFCNYFQTRYVAAEPILCHLQEKVGLMVVYFINISSRRLGTLSKCYVLMTVLINYLVSCFCIYMPLYRKLALPALSH